MCLFDYVLFQSTIISAIYEGGGLPFLQENEFFAFNLSKSQANSDCVPDAPNDRSNGPDNYLAKTSTPRRHPVREYGGYGFP